jgi:transcriptional regulator with XRE-family HTH domain
METEINMTPEEAAALGELLRSKREAQGLSTREVARRAGADVATVFRLEAGQIPSPRPENLKSIGAALGISAADLFAVTDWLPKDQLPTLTPYLRAKYDDLSDSAVNEVEAFIDQLRARHGHNGPVGREDEQS